ncbi:MAG: NAD(P)-binding domain-containing protein [Patescibacteria group bacterium]|nr:NAD(P)-binding domain-containing protein [Patescibacteria group bacterium]
MKVAYFFREEWEREYVRKRIPDAGISFYRGSLADTPSPDSGASVLSIFVDSEVGEEEMKRFPALKLIATRSTGFDHIDMDAARKRGVVVSNVPFYGENTVAEFTFALILALLRRVEAAHRRVFETDTFSQEGLRGFDLAGKTIGIVGGGHIGMRAARIAKGFEMNVLVFDVHEDKDLARETGFSYVSLDELLGRSDIVSIHVPYNEHTHHLLGREALKKMKDGAYLINTARGGVLDTMALIEALSDGSVAGAALDVLEEEGDLGDELELLAGPHPKEADLKAALANHYLMNHPRVIVTPHIAFNTHEAVTRIIDTTIDNIKAFSSGKPENVVT